MSEKKEYPQHYLNMLARYGLTPELAEELLRQSKEGEHAKSEKATEEPNYSRLTELKTPATPTAQWQKEAEEMAEQDQRIIDAATQYAKDHKDPNSDGAKLFLSFVDGGNFFRGIAHAEHTAHMEQVQREIDVIANKVDHIMLLIIEEGSADLDLVLECNNTLIPRLRTITQTKTDKG